MNPTTDKQQNGILGKLWGIVRELADENPDFVYNPGGDGKCYYTKPANGQNKGPGCENGCIIGRALLRYNPDLLDQLVDQDDMGAVVCADDVISEILQICPENRLLSVFYCVQIEQDTGETWESAIKKAIHQKEALLRGKRIDQDQANLIF